MTVGRFFLPLRESMMTVAMDSEMYGCSEDFTQNYSYFPEFVPVEEAAEPAECERQLTLAHHWWVVKKLRNSFLRSSDAEIKDEEFEIIDMQKEQEVEKVDAFFPPSEMMSNSAGDGVNNGIDHSVDRVQEEVHKDHHGPASSFGGEADHFHLFGRGKPLHSALGGGKSADVLLWRNKQISAGMLAGSTVIWLLFEWIGYHLLTFVCHALILMLALLFLWSNLSFFVNKAPMEFPEIVLPEGLCASIALCLRDQCNLVVGVFCDVASGRDLKKFLYAILLLWVVSVVGSWFDFLTLLYMTFMVLLTLPLLYEKNEHQVDTYAKKATVQLKRQYSALDEKVLKKLPSIRRKQN